MKFCGNNLVHLDDEYELCYDYLSLIKIASGRDHEMPMTFLKRSESNSVVADGSRMRTMTLRAKSNFHSFG
ncbi:hypothetical protein RIF29_40458 [Crotalaria pallida]|uniref:Uncharacterized protein n=1 Tax=Crotalaria pallida TaxID=3830 RepID=A0AAN9HQP8_CROPI